MHRRNMADTDIFLGADGVLHVDMRAEYETPEGFRSNVKWFVAQAEACGADLIVSMASKGHCFAAPAAFATGLPLAVIKKGDHALGPDVVSGGGMHFWKPAAAPKKVMLVDDMTCSGNTMRNAVRLVLKAYDTLSEDDIFVRTVVRVAHKENPYGRTTARKEVDGHYRLVGRGIVPVRDSVGKRGGIVPVCDCCEARNGAGTGNVVPVGDGLL